MILRGTLLTMIVLAGTIIAAPVPRYRPTPPPVPGAGEWVITWAGIHTTMLLDKDGRYRSEWGGQVWRGTWNWDASTRTLHISESVDGQTWSNWSANLNEELMGMVQFGANRTTVALKQVKEKKEEPTRLVAAR